VADNLTSKVDYELLCKECDKILFSCIENNSISAIKLLHVLRSSKVELYKYKPIFSKSFFYRIFNTFVLIVKNILFAIYSFTSSIFYKKKYIVNDNNTDFLIISHYTGKKFVNHYADSYFGELISELLTSGKVVTVAFINHTNENAPDLISDKNCNRIVLDNTVSFMGTLSLYLNAIKSISCIKKDKNVKISSRIAFYAKISLFSPSTINNLIIAEQVGRLAHMLSPKHIITTYEGHAWERLVFNITKKVNDKIKCIAYQHAPIFKYQHAIKRDVGGDYDPDIILTTGLVSKKQLEKSNKLNSSKIIVLGSSRYIAAAVKNYKNKNTCLIVPEGEISECLILFKFAMTYAAKNKHVDFIFRLPPIININQLVKLDGGFLNISSNISISKNKLFDDIMASDTVLYRGSSVVVNCASCGLRPIYLKLNNELSIDPLHEIKCGKGVISSHKEFYDVLSEKVANKDIEALAEYCSNIYAPLDYKVLEGLVL